MQIEDWGLISYEEALIKQMGLVENVACEKSPEALIFCSHPPVVTLGRGTEAGDVFAWSGQTIEVSRGGRATYHGPNQLVAYPILDLRREHVKLPTRDVGALLRFLENAVIDVFRDLGLAARAQDTGVWVGDKKIASIGVAVRKWISYHGIAINIDADPNAFQGIKPCGFTTETMGSLEEALGRKVDRNEVQEMLGRKFQKF